VTTDHIGQTGPLWTQELDERIISWKHADLPMPGSQADIALSEETGERWQVADRVRNTCKQLPHDVRTEYLDRFRQEPLSIPDEWQRDLYSFLSWEEVRQLDNRDFSIGSHSVSHPILTTLSPSQLVSELSTSKSRIESELGKPCPWLAYPNGGPADFSPAVIAAAEETGYKVAFTLMERINRRLLDPLAIDRICIPGELSENSFRARLNGFLSILAR
jgi:peptidoglycan/xylan/chitin deacetylase (PgdA/CDA1 family)